MEEGMNTLPQVIDDYLVVVRGIRIDRPHATNHYLVVVKVIRIAGPQLIDDYFVVKVIRIAGSLSPSRLVIVPLIIITI
jgi:hypothetical protein